MTTKEVNKTIAVIIDGAFSNVKYSLEKLIRILNTFEDKKTAENIDEILIMVNAVHVHLMRDRERTDNPPPVGEKEKK